MYLISLGRYIGDEQKYMSQAMVWQIYVKVIEYKIRTNMYLESTGSEIPGNGSLIGI